MIVTALETTMLVCFAVSWPISIYKSWKSRSNKGKSFIFLICILVGYLAGISKIILSDQGNFLLFPYTFNTILVFTDICIYIRNYKIEN